MIGKAIGDCMAQENEFKCIDRRELGNKVIIFKDEKKYKHPYDYTVSNWNAVFLYNAVNLAINKGYWEGLTTEDLMLECYERIAHHFLDESDEFCISGTKEAELQQELQELEEVKKQITDYLQDRLRSIKIQYSIDRRKSAKSDIEKTKRSEMCNLVHDS